MDCALQIYLSMCLFSYSILKKMVSECFNRAFVSALPVIIVFSSQSCAELETCGKECEILASWLCISINRNAAEDHYLH